MKNVPQNAWSNFKKRHVKGDVTDLAQGLATTLIILVPKSQIAAFEKGTKLQDLREDYCKLLRHHTDLKKCKPDDITIQVESKEDFDAKYKRSWYNYFA